MACRKSILTDKRTWVISHADVLMGAYDSAQIADLIRIYILDTLGRIVNLEQIGLYIEMTDSSSSRIATALKP